MSNLFGILAAVLLAVTSFLAFKNKDFYQDQVDARQAEERYRDQAEKTLKETTEKRNVTREKTGAKIDENAELAEAETAQKKVVEELTTKKESLQSIVETKKAEVAEKQEVTNSFGDVPALVEKMQSLTTSKNELATQVAAAQSQIVRLEKTKDETRGQIDKRSGKIRNYTQKKSDPNLKTRISKVMRNWGFVTLAGGDAVGIVKDSTLDVLRNGEKVGEVLVTAVESNTAGASIVPTKNGLPDLYPGDIVMAQLDIPTIDSATPAVTSAAPAALVEPTPIPTAEPTIEATPEPTVEESSNPFESGADILE